MGKFYECDLHKAGCLTYVTLPVWGLPGLVTFLETHHIPYKVCDMLETWGAVPCGYYFRDEIGWDGIAIKSGMDPEELLTLAEGLFYIPFNEISDSYCPVPERYAGCMPADLFEDDRRDKDGGYWMGAHETTADWLWDLYDHNALDDAGACALSGWFYDLLGIPRTERDELLLDPDLRTTLGARGLHAEYYSDEMCLGDEYVIVDEEGNVVETRYLGIDDEDFVVEEEEDWDADTVEAEEDEPDPDAGSESKNAKASE